jgi:thiamine pyrophosphate-dependent acetolactate synthase large subunit-like protein
MPADTMAATMAMSGGQAVVQALADEGVELLFGIPGTHNLPIYRHLPASGIRHVSPRHEQGGGYAADGYARASGRPGVVQATTGPGVLNVATPAATAWADSIPLLILSPAIPTDVEGRDAGFLHQSKDQRGAMDRIVAYSHSASSPQDAYAAVRAAFDSFASSRPRPVHVEVPLEVLDAVADVERDHPTVAARPAPDANAVDRAAALLSKAQRPAFVLGGGARHASIPLAELAERVGAGVLSTVNGKGVVPESHALSLGASLRLPAAQRWLSEADVVLAVGTELGESDIWGPPLQLSGSLIRADVDPGQLDKNAASAVALLGDGRDIAEALLAAVERPAPARQPLADVRAAIRTEMLADGAAFTGLCAALQQALGATGLLAADSTMATYFGAVHQLSFDTPGRLIYPTGYATLGYGLPAGIGAKLARPDEAVVALSGDGGLMFSVAELVTAVEQKLPLPIVVPNDGGYGEIRRQMVHAGIEPLGVDLHVPDLPALARACGAYGKRLDGTDGLAAAIDAALERERPTLLEIPWVSA